jgi:bifunctional non-homologous end joining protein LigD
MPLEEYSRKRKFSATPEPAASVPEQPAERTPVFCVQRHDATRLHYDFRLEVNGVLVSWAVPKGPSMDPARKALAVHVEDHPLDYGTFEGTIPEGNYGAGSVMLWDYGTYEVLDGMEPSRQIERGDFKFALHGHKLRGAFAIIRMKPRPATRTKQEEWLLIKKPDEHAIKGWDVEAYNRSVATQRTQEEIASGDLPPALDELPGVKKAPMPQHLEPMLATLGDAPPAGTGWVYEVKWDGVRALCYVDKGKLRIESRKGNRCEDQYPELAALVAAVDAKQAILDGEIAVLDANGISHFNLIQHRIGVKGSSVPTVVAEYPARIFLFDLLYLDGYDLRDVPLVQRKQQLTRIIRGDEHVRISAGFDSTGEKMLEAARMLGLEGIVAKREASRYEDGRRSKAWLKLKIVSTQELVIAGFTKGEREYFGALVLGVYDKGKLRHAGQVGTGFDQRMMKQIYTRLEPLITRDCPLTPMPQLKGVTWVRPELVCEVKFHEWTGDGVLRAPVFLGLREDKSPREVVRETPTPPAETKADENEQLDVSNSAASSSAAVKPAAAKTAAVKPDLTARPIPGMALASSQLSGKEAVLEVDSHSLKFTNLDKIFYPAERYTKRDVISFYDRVSPWLLPHLRNRPLSLKRYPNGIHAQYFFQKDTPEYYPAWIAREPILEHTRSEPGRVGREEKLNHYLLANDRATLLYLANLGCIDQNPWMSRVGSLEHPDWVLIDLDPVECEFAQIVEAAQVVRHILERFRLRAYPKTTGGDGMHIYIPLEPVYTYEQARTFAELVASLAIQETPDLFTTPRSVGKRKKNRVYFDWMQIATGKTVSAPYVLRAYDGAPVATPLDWPEVVPGLDPKQFHIRNAIQRFEAVGDLFAPVLTGGQRLEEAIQHVKLG